MFLYDSEEYERELQANAESESENDYNYKEWVLDDLEEIEDNLRERLEQVQRIRNSIDKCTLEETNEDYYYIEEVITMNACPIPYLRDCEECLDIAEERAEELAEI